MLGGRPPEVNTPGECPHSDCLQPARGVNVPLAGFLFGAVPAWLQYRHGYKTCHGDTGPKFWCFLGEDEEEHQYGYDKEAVDCMPPPAEGETLFLKRVDDVAGYTLDSDI